jgi:hypothetical protein
MCIYVESTLCFFAKAVVGVLVERIVGVCGFAVDSMAHLASRLAVYINTNEDRWPLVSISIVK